MSICSKCLNDNSVRGCHFNDAGLCNYCEDYAEIDGRLHDYDELEKLFKARLDAVRDKHKYDAVVGISGGKDSAYLLYILTQKYKLKIKAFTMDNGFFSPEARKNVDRLVDEFKIEHEYITFDEKMLRRLYRYSMKKWLVPCIACSFIGYASMIGYAAKVDAGLCIHGRSPQQMLRFYGRDIFTKLVDAGLEHPKDVNLSKLYFEILRGVEKTLDPKIKKEMIKALNLDLDPENLREFVAYFLYHKYDEKKLVAELEKNTTWRRAKKDDYDHYDCLIHNAAHYIYQVAEGRPHILPEISAQIRMGEISKSEGKKMLKEAELKNVPEDELRELYDFVKLNQNFAMFKAKAYNKLKDIK